MIRKEDLANPVYYTGNEKQDRYPQGTHICQVCGNACLEDNFPPNYWQYSGGFNGGRFSGAQKYICLTCVAELEIGYHGSTDIFGKEERTEYLISATPLSHDPDNGVWLTPHDVWREEYKKERGEYPDDRYA